MKWIYPFKSNQLKDHIDIISYSFFSQFDGTKYITVIGDEFRPDFEKIK